MGKFVDSVITYRILRLLTTPFEKTDAYKLGIIDKTGNELKKMSDKSHKLLQKIEAAYEKEDEAMMIRLIKARDSLWT